MKKLMVIMLGLVLVASVAVAVPFSPTPMKLSAPSGVTYQFDGSSLNIPLTVSGVSGTAFLVVSTKDKGASIGKMINGYLGWHEVNKIDTVLYTSPATSVETGSNTIKWDGKGEGGAAVPKGSYTYYIWAVDTNNIRTQVTKQMSFNPWGFRTYQTTDPATGAKLTQPVLFMTTGVRTAAADAAARFVRKWTIGSDPEDVTLRETTGYMGWVDVGGIALAPGSSTNYFTNTQKLGESRITQKWSWVPNGNSVLDSGWGDGGMSILPIKTSSGWYFGPGVINVGPDWLLVTNSDISNTDTRAEIVYLDITDGSELQKFDLANWWVDVFEGTADGGGQAGGGPTEFWVQNNMVFLGSHSTCVNMMWDPYYENASDAVKWVNTNGDYTGDHNFEAAAKTKWLCNDYNVGPYKYNFSADANLFSTFPSFDMGAVSFGLYGPDGTGMGYIALGGETAYQKYGTDFIDYGSAYDGLYTTSNVGRTAAGADATFFYVGHDSIKGEISDQVGVSEAAPAAFTVGQNSPNPFNPTTTITFSIPAAGKVNVDVFNVAGQKIETLVNGAMTAGSHSVTWNASKYSAGVYFYTVNTNGFSKTLKMTLIK